MPSRFEQRFQNRAIPKFARAFGVSVQFHRGSDLSAAFTARRNDREYVAIGAEYGIEVRITMRDFMLPVASLIVNGTSVTPRTGDRIVEGSEIFEIQPIDQNRPSVELQTGSYEYLVHTKMIE